MQNKLLGLLLCRALSGLLLLFAASGLMAQTTDLSSYQGPGISSPGVGSIGTRSGEQVDLRYYFGASGIVDSTFTPFLTDAKGNLIHIARLYGLEVDGGVYGVHSWKRSQLALNYAGSYTRFLNYDGYSGTNHSLNLGYTHEVSRRWILDFHDSAGSLTYGTGQVANAASTDLNSSFTPAVRVFDTRTYFFQSAVNATWLQSARTSYTFGGDAFLQDQKSSGLSNVWGYDFNGNMRRRLSKSTTLGVIYSFSHFEYPEFDSTSNSNTVHGLYATGLGQFWTLSIEAGATFTQGQTLLSFTLNPVLAAIFGQSTFQGISNFSTIYPSGSIALKRQFKRASLGFTYYRGVNSGNGAYVTARADNVGASASYTGIRKVNFGIDGGYFKINAVGQVQEGYSQYSGGAGISYTLGHDIHLSARYDYRDQQIVLSNYKHAGSRATIGLNFSPGSLPLSLW